MTRKFGSVDHRICFTSSAVLPLCLLLSACGGGGMGVANIPPPPAAPTPAPTATPTQSATVDAKTSWLDSPATRAGTYNVIGRLSLAPGNGSATTSRVTAPGEFTMSTDWYFGRESGDLPNYSIHAPTGTLAAGLSSISVAGPFLSWQFNPVRSYADVPSGSYCCQMLGQHLAAYTKGADSSETQIVSNDLTRATANQQPIGTSNLTATLDYDIGFSYVAMGEWSWHVVSLSGGAADSGNLLFVNGDRTPASGVPASGSASYDAHSLNLWSNGAPGVSFALTADFGGRTISTRIDQDYLYTGPVDAPTYGIHVVGSAPFSNEGLFDIPLAGTANYRSSNSPATPPSQAVTGDMNGAFFGPHAEQIGGTFSLQNSGGAVLMQDAFVGQQQHP